MSKVRQTLTAIFLLVTFLGLGGVTQTAQGQGDAHHAGLVVQFGDGTLRTYCIPFAGESISGLDVLTKSGLNVEVEAYGGIGAEVCKIGSEGCPYPEQPCACRSYGPGGVYWSYHHLKEGKWRASVVGADSYKVRDGEVEGWAWSSGKPPAIRSIEQLCPAISPQPPPTNTRQAPSPEPRPSHTVARPTSTRTLPTATRRAVAPTPTIEKSLPTTVRTLATPTKGTSKPTATVRSRPPTETTLVTATPTLASTSTSTNTIAPGSTSIPTAIPTATTSTTATHTSLPTTLVALTPNPTSTLTPDPGIKAANSNPPADTGQATAQSVGIMIGAGALLGLAAWGLARNVRKRTRGPNVE